MFDLKPYSEHKPVGLPWLDSVPAHWLVKRGKSIFRCIDIRSKAGEEELLTVSAAHGVIPRRTATVTMFKAESYAGYKLCWPGDLVINSLWAWGRGLGVSKHHGIVSSAYGVYRLRDGAAMVPAYVDALVRSDPFNWELHVRSKGIWISRLQLTDESFLDAPFPLPPPAEQAGIVRFLGAVDRKVNRFIRAKRRLIEVLTEQKQAIITHAVTKGLNPSAPATRFKPSGIDWLGEVPAHWEVKRLRHIIAGRLTYGANEAAEHDRTDWPRYLRITDFGGDGGLRPDTFRSLPPEIAADYMVQPGDLLLARSGATVGKAFLVDERATNACHAGYLIRARPNQEQVNPRFLFLYTQSSAYSSWRSATFNIATIENIGADKYANLSVPLPPRAEQDAILNGLATLLKPVTGAITVASREIDLIREYRARLVADVVTGKVDVRGVAIPDDPHTADAGDHAGADTQGLDGPDGDGDQGDPDDADAALAADASPDEVEA